MNTVHRRIVSEDPFAETFQAQKIGEIGNWPAWWLGIPGGAAEQAVANFRLRFNLPEDTTIRIHVTADERYKLYLDGDLISSGPSRGDQYHWYYKTYDIDFTKGSHVFVAQVWRLGELAHWAQISIDPGFLLAAENIADDILNTGIAPWEVSESKAYSFRENEISFGPCNDTLLDGSCVEENWKVGEGHDWKSAQRKIPGRSGEYYSNYNINGHHLRPDPLPDMLEQDVRAGKVRHVDYPDSIETWKVCVSDENNRADFCAGWQKLLEDNSPIHVEAHKTVRIIFDLENYFCGYPVVETVGGKGALVRICWAESLFEQPRYDHINNPKGNRDEIEGKYFIGVGDEFHSGDAKKQFEPLWWRAGRYVELLIKTEDQPLTVNDLKIRQTRYPLEMQSEFSCSYERINEIIPLMLRSLQMCSHETLMDCPYYEQLMYAGDARIELLTMYCLTEDTRLARKVIEMFGAGFDSSGIIRSFYPSRKKQIIAPFALWWIGMVYDYGLWRGDRDFVSSFRPKIHCILDTFNLKMDNSLNLIESPNGWNFVDWVPSWNRGVPPQAMPGQTSSIINLQFILAFEYASEIENWCGDRILSNYYKQKAKALLDSVVKNFWCEDKQLLADDLEKKHFSEHAQVLAIISKSIAPQLAATLGESLFAGRELEQTSIYFTHYYFEACRKLRNYAALMKRMNIWFGLKDGGFKTTFEEPGNSRSDCHAWGAHPLYHLFSTFVGIRPTEFGFEKYEIDPLQPESMDSSGKMPVTRGIFISWSLASGILSTEIIEKNETAKNPAQQKYERTTEVVTI